MSRLLTGAAAATAVALTFSLLTTTPASAAPVTPPTPNVPAAAPSDVLISEIASGGPGSSGTGSGLDNFIELTNYGTSAMDIGGWELWRCGETGDQYQQLTVPHGTVLAPGDQYTAVRAGSLLDKTQFADATYSVSLHTYNFGAAIYDGDDRLVDKVGVYHPGTNSVCGSDTSTPATLTQPAVWTLADSYQRIARSGDLTRDWVVAGRTPNAVNATAARDSTARGAVKISEIAQGGPGGYYDDFIELANYGTTAVNVSGWQVWRCGDNGQTYLQTASAGLPSGTIIQPGDAFVLYGGGTNGTGSTVPAAERDYKYTTTLHWPNSGALVMNKDKRIVDRVAAYSDRISACTDGTNKSFDIDVQTGSSYHRIADTHDNSADFQEGLRSPGAVTTSTTIRSAATPLSTRAGSVRVTELAADGPAGTSDQFFELTNVSDAPVDTSGWSAWRCEGTGRRSVTPQVADLGRVLQPGESFVATSTSATGSLRDVADATYSIGFNADGYGIVLLDAAKAYVDGAAVYDTVPSQFCDRGRVPAQNNVKTDLGDTWQRARTVGTTHDDFVQAPRTPGVHTGSLVWTDPTVPTAGALDPVSVPTEHQPGTPVVGASGSQPDATGGFPVSVTTADENGGDVTVAFRSAAAVEITTAATRVYAGTTADVPPASLQIAGEQAMQPQDGTLASAGSTKALPFQRFELPLSQVPADGVEVTWRGTTAPRNEIQLYTWKGSWQRIAAGEPSADGQLVLSGVVAADAIVDGVAHLLVLDGPRTTGGLFDEIGKADRSFVDPGRYDFALNHMTDTQFLSEGFQSVYTQMASWVVANADARKIAYNSHTGDIIEDYLNGYDDEGRAEREFAAAKKIMQLLNDADIPNGVLPGNHDSMWGRNTELYNRYFPPSMYENESWWGSEWRAGDNSAHYDHFTQGGADFIVIHLPYRPSDAQLQWASDVASANPTYNVVLSTHSYLFTSGIRDVSSFNKAARGRALWEKVVAPNDNVFLVLGGHFHGVATNYADPVTGEQVDATIVAPSTTVFENVGRQGRRVVEMLADYQGYRSTQPSPRADTKDRDTGFQRLLQFDLDASLMAVNAYSPHLDSFEAWKYDEPAYRDTKARYDQTDDEFVVQLSIDQRTAFATTGWTVHGVSRADARVTVPAGTAATHVYGAADSGRVWFAIVGDGDGTGEVSAAEAERSANDGVLDEELIEQQSSEVAASSDRGAAEAPVTGRRVSTFPLQLGSATPPVETVDGIELETLTLAAQDGTLSLSLPVGATARLGTASLVDNRSTSVGALPEFAVVDDRVITRPGWTLTAGVTDFLLTTDPTTLIARKNLGTAPGLADSSTSMGIRLGDAQAAGSAVYPMRFASAEAGTGTGRTVLGGDLRLVAPAEAPAGSYRSVMTLTLVGD